MLFSWYVASFESYNRLYGSLGAGIGFMVWIWLSVVVILIGAELNAEMEHQTARERRQEGETSRHARCSHGRPRRSSSKLEASRHPQIKRELGPLSGPSLNRTDVDTDPAPTSEPPRGSHHARAGMPEANRRVRPLG